MLDAIQVWPTAASKRSDGEAHTAALASGPIARREISRREISRCPVARCPVARRA